MSIKDRITSLSRVPASKLIPHPQNWRTHPDDQRAGLASVLNEIGWADAIIARDLGDGTYQIIDGHLRAEMSGEDEVPVLVVDVDEQEAKLLLATHDPLAWMAEHDDAHLAGLLGELTGYGDQVAALLDSIGEAYEVNLGTDEEAGELDDVEPQIDRAEELRVQWGTERGQVWVIEGKQTHRLMCGDSSNENDLSSLFGSDQAQLIVTSPPYNQNVGNFSKSGMHKETKWVDNTNIGSYSDNMTEDEYQKWQSSSLTLWSGRLTDNASIFYNHKNRFRDKQCLSPWRWLENSGAKCRQEIIWLREGSVTQNMRGFMPVDERIFWLYFGDDFLFHDTTENKTFSTVWKINSHKDRDGSSHGCQFPLEIPARCIRCCSDPGDIIFEPYGGSGTTILASDQLGRSCYAMELLPKYCAVILQRMTDAGCKCRLLEPAAT